MDEAYSLPISALQHYMYCPRQCALIHIERIWQDNNATAEGQIVHQQVDHDQRPDRGEIKYAHALHLGSERLRIHGIADLVELHTQHRQLITILPVEFKRGKPKTHLADIIQVCAQALCLEEMFQQPIRQLALFYAKTKRRLLLDFTDQLRSDTLRIIDETITLVRSGKLPQAVYRPECQACSLIHQCLPQHTVQITKKRDQLFDESLNGHDTYL